MLNDPDKKVRKSAIENISCISRMINTKEINTIYNRLKQDYKSENTSETKKFVKKNLNFLKFQNLDTITKYTNMSNKLI